MSNVNTRPAMAIDVKEEIEMIEQMAKLSIDITGSNSEVLEINDPRAAIVQQQVPGEKVVVLVIMKDGQQRLVTYYVPGSEHSTLQDLIDLLPGLDSHRPPRTFLLNLSPHCNLNYIVDYYILEESEESITFEEEQ